MTGRKSFLRHPDGRASTGGSMMTEREEDRLERRQGKRPAEEIQIRSSRLSLFWPLTLHMETPPDRASVVDFTADGFARDIANAYKEASDGQKASMWRPVEDPLEHYPKPDIADFEKSGGKALFDTALMTWENEAYAEAIYFHEFVQAFLYRPHEGAGLPPFYLFQRSDLRGANVVFGKDANKVIKYVGIERVNLYIFRTGVAIFTMDMVLPEEGKTALCGWNLAEFEDFHDLVRRAYAPYFSMNNGKRHHSDLVIQSISWLDKDGDLLKDHQGKGMFFDLAGDMDQVTRYVGSKDLRGDRSPPVFRHWRTLLPEQLPLAPYQKSLRPDHAEPTKEGDISAEGNWHHVVDERMPTLAMIDVTGKADEPSRFDSIRRRDYVRLCFADNRGWGGYPYDYGFLSEFEKNHCYDRFFAEGTRLMVSGYSFVAVSAGGFAPILATHLKRHYFQMALMAHMEVASLLSFSGQISRAVQRFGNEIGEEAERKFEQAMAAIQEQFLLFVHRFRFTGVSNQVQGQELFDMWRKQLRSQDMFTDVENEISVANDYLQARADRRTSEAGEKLAMLGGIAVLIGTVIGLLGMNFFFDDDTWNDTSGLSANVSKFLGFFPVQGFIAGVVIMMTAGIGHLWLRPKWNARANMALEQGLKFVGRLFGVGALMVLVSGWLLTKGGNP